MNNILSLSNDKKKDFKNILILFGFLTVEILLIIRFKYWYGSTTDWINQHWAIPDYFRTLFYDTHQLFPNFAFNLGAGQNIYNLAYYGLFSPQVFLSYLFPFVPMIYFIIIYSIITLYADCILFYVWIRKQYDSITTFVITFLFIFSAPLIYHSHHHIMFVNYMPFLLLAYILLNKLNTKNIKAPFLISCLMIIMSSFYFSVGAFISIILYSVFIKLKESSSFKKTIAFVIKAGLCMAVSVMISAILILPTFVSLLSGRSQGNKTIVWTSLLVNLNFLTVLYNPFSLGLTVFCFICLIASLFSKKKNIKFLAICLNIIFFLKIFSYAMNGTMYIEDKVLIPFLPLVLLLAAEYLGVTLDTKRNFVKTSISIGFVLLLSMLYEIIKSDMLTNIIYKLLCALVFTSEVIICCISLYKFRKTQNKKSVYIPLMIVTFIIFTVVNISDKLVPLDRFQYKNDTEIIDKMISDTLKNDPDFYRISNLTDKHNTVNRVYNSEYYESSIYSSIHNKNLNDFYFNGSYNENTFRNSALTVSSDNYIYNLLMGNKYLFTLSTDTPNGYYFVKNYGKFSIFKNDYSLPVGYISDNIMSYNEFNKLEYPYNIEARAVYTIVDNAPQTHFNSKIEKTELIDKPEAVINISNAQNNKIVLKLKKDYTYTYNLKKPVNNCLLLVRMNVDNRSYKNPKDIYIDINGTTNLLTQSDWKYRNENYTFDYMFVASQETDNLDFTFSKGNYSIDGLTIYTIPLEEVNAFCLGIDEFKIDRNKTFGDTIYGTINSEKGGNMVLSVPYDKGFKITVDGIATPYNKVNSDFIGINVDKGNHTIIINYKAPYRNISELISITGLLILFILVIYDILLKKNNKSILKSKS